MEMHLLELISISSLAPMTIVVQLGDAGQGSRIVGFGGLTFVHTSSFLVQSCPHARQLFGHWPYLFGSGGFTRGWARRLRKDTKRLSGYRALWEL